MIPVVLDTDLSGDVDDALALALLLSAPDALRLVAVTTVSGDTRARARGAARILALAGRSDVAVHPGVKDPLVRRLEHEIETEGYGTGELAPILDEPAPERIVRAAREAPGLELVTIGPLTNVAHALALDPRLPERVGRLTVMGGHVRQVKIGQHVCAPGIDYNLCSDPEASVCVLGAGFRTRLVTADVTLQVWMTEAQRSRLAGSGRPLQRVLAELIARWTPKQVRIFTGMGGTLAPDNAAFLHDPLCVLSLIDAASLRFESLSILPTIQRGVLRTFEVDAAIGVGAPMEVATAVDAIAAREAIVARLLSL
jgi:purine nucleosidase